MQIDIHESKRIVCVWLTRNESVDPGVQDMLKSIYKQYQSQNYMVAVFCSGKKKLCELTSELLKYNRRELAKQEVLSQRN